MGNPYSDCNVTPTWENERGRKFVTIQYPDGTKETKSFARYTIEKRRGERLPDNMDVHHKDGDPTNDDPENLQVLTSADHAKLHAETINDRQSFDCPWCGDCFTLEGEKLSKAMRNLRYRKKKDRVASGPFCSKSCAGKYGAAVQKGDIEPVPTEPREVNVE